MADWDFYELTLNDQRAFAYLDLAYYEIAPIQDKAYLHWLWLKLQFPNEEGLSTDQEYDQLIGFEDLLVQSMPNHTEFVGRFTTDGTRQFYFYAPAPTPVVDWYEHCLGQYSSYRYQYDAKHDPGWHQYLHTLYPGPNGMEQIMRRRDGNEDG